jgi:hypothetical protein
MSRAARPRLAPVALVPALLALAAAPARGDLRAQLIGEWNRSYGTALRFTPDGKCAVAHSYTQLDKPAARRSWSLEAIA